MPSNGTAQRGTRMVNSNGKGRICLVTGSGARTGLGYAMVDAFAREGAKVVVSDIAAKQKEGQAIVDEINSKWGAGNAIWVAIDVTKEEDWKAGIEKIEAEFGPLDVCCNKWVFLVISFSDPDRS